MGTKKFTDLKVVNYNLWHGLNGAGTLSFGELEPALHRKKRYKIQNQILRDLDADVLFLQEVNPLYVRAQELSRALNMDYIAQVDQAGMKVAGFGIPTNLNTGLLILARKNLNLKFVKGLKLSGGLGFCSHWLSLQLAEFRYALVGRIKLGREDVLLINTHLHHGPTSSKRLEQVVRKSTKNAEAILGQIRNGENRRVREVLCLLNYVSTLKVKNKIICGDLNVSPEDPLLDLFGDQGFLDVFSKSSVLTWNPPANRENHRFTQHLKSPIFDFGQTRVQKILKAYDARPRRIDYIFTSKGLAVVRGELVLNRPKNEMIGSDHFGLMAHLNLTR